MDGEQLGRVKSFKYLRSTVQILNENGDINDEITEKVI